MRQAAGRAGCQCLASLVLGLEVIRLAEANNRNKYWELTSARPVQTS